MNHNHPSYLKPTIQEALCEVRFKCKDAAQWDSQLFTQFYEIVKDKFPGFEPFQAPSFQLNVSGQAMTQNFSPGEQRIRYKSDDDSQMIQFGEHSFIVNFIGKYDGWPMVKKTVLDNWGRASGLLGELIVGRIGLRYINRLPLIQNTEPVGVYLRSNDYLPSAFVSGKGRSFLRVESSPGEGRSVAVTVGENKPLASEEGKVFMFDIDCVYENSHESQVVEVEEVIETLHTNVWQIFDASKTDKLEKHLNGESV